jgi:signal peptidase II
MILTGVSMLVIALDQLTKFFVLQSIPLNQSVTLIPDFFYFTYIQNPGTAFGFMSNMENVVRIPFFVTVTLAAAFIVYTYHRFIPEEKILTRIALGLVWGGALGNFVDRLLYGRVIDFIDVRYHDFQWYIFNVADSCITIGLLYLFFEFVLEKRKEAAA